MSATHDPCANCGTTLAPKEHGGHMFLVCEGCQYWWTDDKLALCRQYMRSRPDCSLLSLVYEPNGTDHDDLVVGLSSWRYRCDTYYYKLDHPAGSASDVPGAIKRLLELWLRDMDACGPDHATYLPYDFSDQYTGWLRCGLKANGEWQILPGWSDKEGWAFYPTDYEDVAKGLDDFRPVQGDLEFTLQDADLRRDIALAIADVESLGA